MSDSQDITCLCDLVEEANTIAMALGVVNPVLPNTLDQCVCYRAHVDEASHDGYLARRTPARTCTTLFFEKNSMQTRLHAPSERSRRVPKNTRILVIDLFL